MASSGGTTGTAIAGGSGTGLSLAQPLQRTILPLQTFAKIMGLTPPHFSGGYGDTVFPVACQSVWPRYSWQDADRISHEDLANTIYNVEEEIASYLGYYPGPKWIAKEMHPYPRHYRQDVFSFGADNRSMFKSIQTRKGRFIASGQRAVSSVGTATVAGGSLAYTDEDGDGFSETATITLATSLTNACEINAYFTGKSGAQEWEIRHPRSKTLTGGNIVMVFDSWLFIDPDTLSTYPTDAGWSGVNLSTTAELVTSVDVYREYTDFSQESAEFSWEPKPQNSLLNTFCTSCGGSGCVACESITQTGCTHVRDTQLGIVVPTPATYDNDDAAWAQATWTECREPEQVKLWYYAGDLSEQYLRGETCDPLSLYYAQAIAYMTTARLDREPCACANIRAMFMDLRRDLSFTDENSGSYFLNPEDINNPFGTRKGEIMAWRKLAKLTEQIPGYAIV